ncbi:MAG: NADH-quinone oxidoreductase subunit M [Planctomycetes bacterium]|nr:NADH-quinone oxidoreductase subunit M [Planctomycetota bacterium]
MMAILNEWVLTWLIILPLVGTIAVAIMRTADDTDADRRRVGRAAFAWSLAVLALAVAMVLLFCRARDETGGPAVAAGEFALSQNVSWIGDVEGLEPVPRAPRYLDLRYHVGVDGLSVWLVLLSALLTTLSVWASFTYIRTRVKEFYALVLLLEMGMIGVFCARDLLLFYVFFEFTLIPLFFLIAIWGGTERRFAAIKFFLYTFTGSMLTFAGVLYLAYAAYSLPAELGGGRFTFDLDTLHRLRLTDREQWWLFLAFAAGFAVKVPLWPFHTWLPLAHTEAPTAGSVLLAGILLKLGTYGFLRFNIPLFPAATQTFAPMLAVLAIIGVVYAALAAWVQGDMKKLVAYSSVSHLGFCILGMFSLKQAGVTGSVLHMINHGLSTGALFLVVGMIYERYHTREFGRLGGLARRMPTLSFFLVFFALASIGVPGLTGFVSEVLVLLGTSTARQATAGSPAGPLGVAYAAFAATGVILSAIYMLAMCQRVLFGPLVEPAGGHHEAHDLPADLTRREIAILTPIAVLCLVLGIYPKPVIDTINPAVDRQVLAFVHPQPDAREPLDAFADANSKDKVGRVNSDTSQGRAPVADSYFHTFTLSHVHTLPPEAHP